MSIIFLSGVNPAGKKEKQIIGFKFFDVGCGTHDRDAYCD
jgi:hypothetical protein